jgi:hypothetical protein
MSYTDIVIRTRPLPILETWPPIYRGQERTERDILKASQALYHVYFQYTDIIICIEPDRFLETWPPIYRGPGEAGQGEIESKPS